MGKTKLTVLGEFTKEQLARLVRLIFEMQKEINPKGAKEEDIEWFMLHISNDVYTDAEVRKIIRENFKDAKITDLDEPRGFMGG